MKILPCTRCRQPALATRDGVLQSAGKMLDTSMRYLCRRCGHVTKLSSLEFAQLPDMTAREVASSACDLPASAHPGNLPATSH